MLPAHVSTFRLLPSMWLAMSATHPSTSLRHLPMREVHPMPE